MALKCPFLDEWTRVHESACTRARTYKKMPVFKLGNGGERGVPPTPLPWPPRRLLNVVRRRGEKMALSQLFGDLLTPWHFESPYFSLKMINFLSLNFCSLCPIYVLFWIKYWHLLSPHHCIQVLFTICLVSQPFWNPVCTSMNLLCASLFLLPDASTSLEKDIWCTVCSSCRFILFFFFAC